MRVEVNGVRLFVDVVGPALVPDGLAMRERPTVVVLHGGPGSDHIVGWWGARRLSMAVRTIR